MLEVQAKPGKNQLHLRHLGPLVEADAQRYGEAILREMDRLRPGFDVIIDLTRSGPLGPTLVAQAQMLMRESKARGVSRHVIIVGGAQTATVQMERLSREMGHEGFLAASWEEAERLLERRRL
jgi:hypothetical protein